MFSYLKKNKIIRWYLVLIPISWLALLLSYSAWQSIDALEGWWVIALWGVQTLLMCYMLVMSSLFFIRMMKWDKQLSAGQHQEKNHIRHVVLLPFYRERLAIVESSLKRLCQQSIDVKDKLIVVISLEEKTPDADQLTAIIQEKYQHFFHALIVIKHPFGLAGEIPGKCSNVRWAAIKAYEYLQQQHIDLKDVTMTSMDIDVLLHDHYFEALANQYLALDEQQRCTSIWQPGQFFNWGLAKVPFFTRIIALYRTIWMIGFNIPMQVNAMAVFSSSFKLCVENDFFNPAYQMDDICYFISCLIRTKGKLKLRAIYLPIISGPTSGKNWLEASKEWTLQGKRWSIGAFEMFHYSCLGFIRVKMKSLLYHAVILGIVYGIFQGIISLSIVLSIATWRHDFLYQHEKVIWYCFSSMPLLFSLWPIILDAIFVRRFSIVPASERVGLIKNIVHYIFFPIVVIVYSLLSFIALHELALRGRAVCGHRAADKANLTVPVEQSSSS